MQIFHNARENTSCLLPSCGEECKYAMLAEHTHTDSHRSLDP